MNWKRQLFLAVALFALGSYAYWSEYKQKPKKDAEGEQAKKVFHLKDTTVESIKISNGTKSVELKCMDVTLKLCRPGDTSKWYLESPLKTRADDPNVNGLVSALSNLDPSDTIDLKDETPEKRAALLKEYGLDPDSRKSDVTRKIEVTVAGKPTLLYLGQTHPIGEGIFSVASKGGQLDETKVYVVPGFFKANLEHDLTYWRDKKLITIPTHEVGGFELKSAKSDLAGTRTNGIWRLKIQGGKDKGEELFGDGENIDNVLNGASYLVAKDFISDHKDDARAKAVLKTAKQLLTLTITQEKLEVSASPSPKPAGEQPPAESVTLVLYQKNSPLKEEPPKDPTAKLMPKPAKVQPKIYATVSNLDPLYELEAYSKDRIDKELKELRLSKLISTMERYQIKKLQFEGPSGQLELSNVEGKWVPSDKSDVDQDKVQALLDKLSGTRIKEFSPLIKVSATPPKDALKVTIVGDEKTPLRRQFTFWKGAPGLYAQDLGSTRKDKEALLMEPGLVETLPWTEGFFKKAPPAPSPSPAAPLAAAAKK